MVNAVDTGMSFGGAVWFSYQTLLPAIGLPAGKYWVSIVENDLQTPAVGDSQWLWGYSDNHATTRAYRGADTEAWNITGSNSALRITGTIVPEPAGAEMLLLGAVGVVVWGKRLQCISILNKEIRKGTQHM